MKHKAKELSIAVAIDPLHVGSMVIGYVGKPTLKKGEFYESYSAHMFLSDCNKTIRWELVDENNGTDSIKKLNKAIDAMVRIRDALVHNVEPAKEVREEASRRRKERAKKKSGKGPVRVPDLFDDL